MEVIVKNRNMRNSTYYLAGLMYQARDHHLIFAVTISPSCCSGNCAAASFPRLSDGDPTSPHACPVERRDVFFGSAFQPFIQNWHSAWTSSIVTSTRDTYDDDSDKHDVNTTTPSHSTFLLSSRYYEQAGRSPQGGSVCCNTSV